MSARSPKLTQAFVFALLGACALGCTRAQPPERARAIAVASASASTKATPAAPAPETADPVVDLLHTVDCTVAVSSKVDNPTDFPEHLVDGKEETAWNSRTGDLQGAIYVRVPKKARVTRIELSAGFDKIGPQGDLFTKNHRITRIRISRPDGRTVVVRDLDPKERKPQPIDVDEPGGDFEIRVLATLPGTEPRWKELTVSELRVWGRAGGAPPNPSHLPRMAVGDLDGVRPHVAPPPASAPVGPFPDIHALCAAYDAAMSGPIARAFPGDRYPGKIPGPYCQHAGGTSIDDKVRLGPFLGGELAIVSDTSDESERLVLRTPAGISLTKVTSWSRGLDDPGCLHGGDQAFEDAWLETTPAGEPVLLIRWLHKEVSWGMPDPDARPVVHDEIAYACHVDAAGAAVCEGPLRTGHAADPLPGTFDPSDAHVFRLDPSSIHWQSRKRPVLGPAGDLRLEP